MAEVIVVLDGKSIALRIFRSSRARRASLRIGSDGSVTVVVPARAGTADGIAIARANASWIRERLAALPPRVPFADGAIIPIHGQQHTIRHRADLRASVIADGMVLSVGGPAADVPRKVAGWLRERARSTITSQVEQAADRLGRGPSRIILRDTRSRWGSCSSAGVLSFSWRLILAPPAALAYVVVHEVAHLAVRGHGRDFWKTVGTLASGDVEAARDWLRVHGYELFRFG